MLHPLLKNVLQTIDHFEISCIGTMFSWLEKPINCMGQDMDCMADVVPPIHFFQAKHNSIQISPHAISGLFQP
jgi:hypothetical protein